MFAPSFEKLSEILFLFLLGTSFCFDMLRSLIIRDFVIVDRAELEFGSGFTALTGETGAGKSILIDALQLVLGERADAAVVRQGAEKAEITAALVDLDLVTRSTDMSARLVKNSIHSTASPERELERRIRRRAATERVTGALPRMM